VSGWCWNGVYGLSSKTTVASRSPRVQESSECRPPSNKYRKFEVEEMKLLLSIVCVCCRIMLSLSSQESMCRTSWAKLLSSFSGVASPQPGGGSLFGSCVEFPEKKSNWPFSFLSRRGTGSRDYNNPRDGSSQGRRAVFPRGGRGQDHGGSSIWLAGSTSGNWRINQRVPPRESRWTRLGP